MAQEEPGSGLLLEVEKLDAAADRGGADTLAENDFAGDPEIVVR